jgi:hemoglobin
MSTTRTTLALILAAAFLCCAAYAKDEADTDSLYSRIGGSEAVSAIASELVDRAAHDPLTARSWEKVELSRVKQMLAEYLCSQTGGGCTYTGDSMKDVHAGLDITEAEMYRLVEQLREVMQDRHIALRDRNAVLAILAPTKRDVVTK